MAIRNIVGCEEPILKKKSRPVTEFNDRLWGILDDMGDTVKDADGAGLAAPQVGVLRRYFVMNFDDEIIEMINPEIIETKGEQDGLEGCLSFPGQYGLVKRPNYVKAKAQNRFGEEVIIEGEGIMARCICHETDHLNGVTFDERAHKIFTPDELDDYLEKQEKQEKKNGK